jgi:peptidoglycan/xylan/chitin deacetylase (PgdA/CDA1 family)
MPLGDFGAGGPGDAALRRVLHGMHAPAALFLPAARLASGRRAARVADIAERYAYWRGARRALDQDTWRRLTHGTAILMYHALGRPNEPAGRFVVPATRFERQLAWLARRGRPVIQLDELVAAREEDRLPPAGAVVLTFDDGYVDNLDVAAPILRRFGVPATVFVVSSRVGEKADWDGAGELSARPLLSWEELAELQRSEVSIGAHTRTHRRLWELSEDEVNDEIEGSRAELTDELSRPVRAFAYPFGRVIEAAAAAVAKAGFESACGIGRGLNHPGVPPLLLRRAPVDGDASMLRFALAVRFGDPDLLAQPLRRLGATVTTAIRRRPGRAAEPEQATR